MAKQGQNAAVFDLVLGGDHLADLGDFLVTELAYMLRGINACLLEYVDSGGSANSVNVSQADLGPLVFR